jgi:hypothetical protein
VGEAVVLGIVITITLGVIIWDLKLATDKVEGNTISEIMTKLAHKHPMVSFAWGVLMGHWFW